MEERVVVASSELGCSFTSHDAIPGSPVCTLVIPNTLLLRLHDKKSSCGYVGGVNACISEQIYCILLYR